MLLEELREIVWKCNLELPKNDLVKMTSGNISGRDPETGLVVIKPSGYSYEEMTARRHGHRRHGRQGRRRPPDALGGHRDASLRLCPPARRLGHRPHAFALREQLRSVGQSQSRPA